MRLRDHERARMAYEHVHGYQELGPEEQQKYGSMCLKLPVLVHSAGLAQALHFLAARGHPHQKVILDHLAEQLGLEDRGSLLAATRNADLAETQRLTREVQRCLQWYKRFTQSELKNISPTDDDGESPRSTQ